MQSNINSLGGDYSSKIQEAMIDDITNKRNNSMNRFKDMANSIDAGISSIEDMGKKANQMDKDPQGANKIILVTKDDNIVHDYFHYFECWWDASNCLSGVLLKMPKTEEGNTNYWINYVGDIIVYMGNGMDTETVTNQSEKDGTYWDLQGLYPFFVGSTSRIKEKQNELEIYIDSVGRRFKSKIPNEFRQAFINNQNVRDAFQAICEFLGVYYICPPPTAKQEDEDKKNKSATKDGNQNDAGKKNEKEEKLASQAKKKNKKTRAQLKKERDQKLSKNKANNSLNNTGINTNTHTNNNNNNNNQNDGLNTEETDVQLDGYKDINFDASGAIVHGQKVIETSPDMAETLIALEEYPLRGNYEEKENKYILEDVEKLLNGEIFENIHNSVMDYGAITIEPKAAASTNMSTTGATGQNNNNNNNKNKESDTTHATADMTQKARESPIGLNVRFTN